MAVDVITPLLEKLTHAEESSFAESFAPALLIRTGATCRNALDADAAKLKKAEKVLFPDTIIAHMGHDIAGLFTEWRAGSPPSIPALLIMAADHFKIDKQSPMFQAALLAGIAAETPHDNPYHSPYHFREVVAGMMRLCHVHNAQSADKLSPDDIALCLATAAAHDLKHDGGTNLRNGVHIPAFLELKAIAALKPLAEFTGVSDRQIEDMGLLIHVTDISGKDNLRSMIPKLQKAEPAALPAEFARLGTDKRLLNMAAMMSDADLTPSVATSHSFNAGTSHLLYKENPAIAVASFDKGLIFFIENILGGSFVSESGKSVGNQAMGAILQKARLNIRKDPAPK